MSALSSAIILLSLLNCHGNAIKNLSECPRGCSCDFASSRTQLNIDCGRSTQDADKLLPQFDSFLSDSDVVERLTSVSIINTPLTRVPASVCLLLNLTSLQLVHNAIAQLPNNCFTKLTKLVTLSLAFNAIVGLQDGLFNGLQSLQSLDLSQNQVSSIGLRLFSNASDLTHLRWLYLNNNRLTSLEPWCYYRLMHGSKVSPVTVSLNDNPLSNFTNKLQLDFRCGMKPMVGFLDLGRNQIEHVMDILQGWNIADYTKYVCLRNFQKSRHPLFSCYIGGLNYACDCTDFPVFRWQKMLPRSRQLQDVYCNNFETPTGQAVLARTLPLIEFVCDVSDRCPSGCKCVYRPANTTLHVYCSSANLSSLPRDLPPLRNKYDKYKLDFSDNKVFRNLEHRPYFANIAILDVSNCSLTEIAVNVLKDVFSFKVANFRWNLLLSLPQEASTMNISASLLLGHNPWECSCDNSWMILWLRSLSNQILDAGDIICESPERLYGINFLKSTSSDFCEDPAKRIFVTTVSVACTIGVVILLPIIVGLLVFKFREKCYKRWKFHPFDRDECVGEDMDFDMFLCCSSLDYSPHAMRIIELIEANGYRVCYHDRDFLPGSLITDNMVQSVERSKRTVCFVSNNFLQSSYCMTEFEMAYHHNVVVKRKKRLVVLMALDSPSELYANDASDTAALRLYVRHYTYIDYKADDWLDRLLYALPLHGMLQAIEDHNDGGLLNNAT